MTWKQGAELAFKGADVFFKFVTWLFALAALHFLGAKVPGFPLNLLVILADLFYVLSLIIVCVRIIERKPSEMDIKGAWVPAFKALETVLGVGIMMVLTSPLLYLDHLIEAIIRVSHPSG